MSKYEKISQKIRLLLYAHPMTFSEVYFRITNSREKNHSYPSSSIRGRISEMRKRGLIEKRGNKHIGVSYGLTDNGKRYRENEI